MSLGPVQKTYCFHDVYIFLKKCVWMETLSPALWWSYFGHFKEYSSATFDFPLFSQFSVFPCPRWSASTAASRPSVPPGSSRRRPSTGYTPGSSLMEVRRPLRRGNHNNNSARIDRGKLGRWVTYFSWKAILLFFSGAEFADKYLHRLVVGESLQHDPLKQKQPACT